MFQTDAEFNRHYFILYLYFATTERWPILECSGFKTRRAVSEVLVEEFAVRS